MIPALRINRMTAQFARSIEPTSLGPIRALAADFKWFTESARAGPFQFRDTMK